MRILENVEPNRVFYYFEELTKIPRCSFKEKRVSDYLREIGNNLGLETIQDEELNIIIRKPASKGYETAKGVIIQGHMDMVCEKENNIYKNFSKDGVDIYIDGDFIKAKGTTLGADNGIAIAMGLAILEDKSLKHPEIELLITTNEEVTMGGAMGLSKDVLKGERYINLDSEEEGTLTLGAAGGVGLITELELEYEELSNHIEFELKLEGLKGGHSGLEIHKPLENANKLLNEILTLLYKEIKFNIVDISGGTKDNAIPRNSKVSIAIKEEDIAKFINIIEDINENMIDKYLENEPDIEIIVEEKDEINRGIDKNKTKKILKIIEEINTGVYTNIQDNKDLVESSSNLAIVKIEGKKLFINTSLRSSNPNIMEELANNIIQKVEPIGAKVTKDGGYPEWEYKSESELREIAVETYKKLTGKEMKTTVLHAGLECGVINEKYPNMDIISYGPNLYNVHTPKEKMSISSVKNVYEYTLKLLENLK